MSSRNKKNRKSDSPKKSLLSHTTILILSFYLVGLASGHLFRVGDPFNGILMGLFGLTAYLGLGYASQHRRQKSAEAEIRKAIRRVERRLDRHVPGDTLQLLGSPRLTGRRQSTSL